MKEFNVITENLASIGTGFSYLTALEEGITNAISATKGAEERRVEIRKFVGKTHTLAKNEIVQLILPAIKENESFLMIMNSGVPVASLEEMMHNGISTKDGDNHQYGVGHLAVVGKYSPSRQVYATFTRYKDHCEWVSGPYKKNPPHGEFEIEDWPFDDWCVTVTICLMENANVVKDSWYDKLCERYTVALIQDNDLKIFFCTQKLKPVIPKKAKLAVFHFYIPEIDSDVDVYEYTFKNNNGKTKEVNLSGITIATNGLTISNEKVSIISKATALKKQKGPKDWDPDFALSPKINMHHDFNGFATFVNVRPRSTEHLLETGNDKSEIIWDWDESPNAMILRWEIDTRLGNRFREARERAKEMRHRLTIDEHYDFATYENEHLAYLKEVAIPKCSNENEISKLFSDKADGMLLEITDANRDAINEYRKNGGIYLLGQKDCHGIMKIIEFKKSGKPLESKDLSQLVDYGEKLQRYLGVNPDKIHLCLSGGKKTEDVMDSARFKSELYGYTICVLERH